VGHADPIAGATGDASGVATDQQGTGMVFKYLWPCCGGCDTNFTFGPDERRLASAGFDAKIKIFDAESGLELLMLSGHTS
jgi:hypothetical protein